MTKFIAIVNVIAWSGFWAFGFIALTSDDLTGGRVEIAAVLALIGLVVGIFAWRHLCRAAEKRGYVRAARMSEAPSRAKAQEQWDN